MQNAIDSTKDCAENRIPYLSVHKVHLINWKWNKYIWGQDRSVNEYTD